MEIKKINMFGSIKEEFKDNLKREDFDPTKVIFQREVQQNDSAKEENYSNSEQCKKDLKRVR